MITLRKGLKTVLKGKENRKLKWFAIKRGDNFSNSILGKNEYLKVDKPRVLRTFHLNSLHFYYTKLRLYQWFY